jgi:hypothetical protein
MELLRNSKDKKARKLTKKRVSLVSKKRGRVWANEIARYPSPIQEKARGIVERYPGAASSSRPLEDWGFVRVMHGVR